MREGLTKTVVLLAMIVLNAINAYSQDIILLKDGREILGSVEFVFEQPNSVSITSNNQKQTFIISDVLHFSMGGKKFEPTLIKRPNGSKLEIFAELLLKGDVNLFRFYENGQYFYCLNKREIHEYSLTLYSSKYLDLQGIKSGDYPNYFEVIYKYLVQLTNDDKKNIQFNEQSFIKAVLLHNTRANKVYYVNKLRLLREARPYTFSVFGGAYFGSNDIYAIDLQSYNINYSKISNSSNRILVGLDVVFNNERFNKTKFIAEISLFYDRNSIISNTEFTDFDNSSSFTEPRYAQYRMDEVLLSGFGANLGSLIRFDVSRTFSISGGISWVISKDAYNLTKVNYEKYNETNQNFAFTYERKISIESTSFKGYKIGAGVDYKLPLRETDILLGIDVSYSNRALKQQVSVNKFSMELEQILYGFTIKYLIP